MLADIGIERIQLGHLFIKGGVTCLQARLHPVGLIVNALDLFGVQLERVLKQLVFAGKKPCGGQQALCDRIDLFGHTIVGGSALWPTKHRLDRIGVF